MSDAREWANRSPATAGKVAADVLVLACFTIVDLPELSVDLLNAATDLPRSALADAVRDLAAAGMLAAGRPDWYRVRTDSAVVDGIDDDLMFDLRRRFVDHLLGMVASTASAVRADLRDLADARTEYPARPPFAEPEAAWAWLADNLTACLAGVRIAGIDQRLYGRGHRLARMLWRVIPHAYPVIPWPDWYDDLARWGEDAAIRDRDPSALADVLESSARTAMNNGELLTAEAQWIRALAVRRRLDDRLRLILVLRSLVEMYRSWGRLHRALDAAFEMVSEFQRGQPDPAGLADALAVVGRTMLAANRPDSAAEYLERSVDTYGYLASPAPIDHARALMSWGVALWRRGAWGLARRRFSSALALLVDVDDDLAGQVRDLMRQADGQPLPDV